MEAGLCVFAYGRTGGKVHTMLGDVSPAQTAPPQLMLPHTSYLSTPARSHQERTSCTEDRSRLAGGSELSSRSTTSASWIMNPQVQVAVSGRTRQMGCVEGVSPEQPPECLLSF
jgi:hypothetical protein